MKNKLTINILPVILTERHKKNSNWQLTHKIAKQVLDVAKQTYQRDLEQNIAIKFADEIVLTLSINPATFKIKIDYSQIKSKKTIELIKLYLSRNMEAFAEEWVKPA